jgi:hypothetical protein
VPFVGVSQREGRVHTGLGAIRSAVSFENSAGENGCIDLLVTGDPESQALRINDRHYSRVCEAVPIGVVIAHFEQET